METQTTMNAGEILREKYCIKNSEDLTSAIRKKIVPGNTIAETLLANRGRTLGEPTVRYSTEINYKTYPEASSITKRAVYPEVSDTLNRVLVINEPYIREESLFGCGSKEKLPFLLETLSDIYTLNLPEPMQARSIEKNGTHFAIVKSGVHRNISYPETKDILYHQITDKILDLMSFGFDRYRRSYLVEIPKLISLSKKLRDEDWKRSGYQPVKKKSVARELTYSQWQSYKRAKLNPNPALFDKAYSVCYSIREFFGGRK